MLNIIEKISYTVLAIFCLLCIFCAICYEISKKQVIQEVLSSCYKGMTVEICELEIKKAQKVKEYNKLLEEQKVLLNEITPNK